MNMYITGIKKSSFPDNGNVIQNKSYSCNTCLQNGYKKIPAGKISYIYFTGANKTTPTPFLKSTTDKIDLIYENYEKNLMEIPEKDIKKITKNIQKETNFQEYEILDAMGVITQFGNIKSAQKISKTLNDYNIGEIGNTDGNFIRQFSHKSDNCELKKVVKNDNGLHGMLNYILNKKQIGPTKKYDKNTAIFLDNSKLNQLENLKKNNEKDFNELKKNDKIKFFIISGWENGINFTDRTKDLEETTKDLLFKAEKNKCTPSEFIDKNISERANKLGLSPIIIKNETEPNTKNIYKNLAPVKMSKNDLLKIIDITTQGNISGEENLITAKDIAADYLNSYLEIYSPERLSYSLKDLHEKINNFAEENGFDEEDILYVIPEHNKSYDYITYSYQKINNIPDSKIITGKEVGKERENIKNKLLVITDDCSMTGNSVLSVMQTFFPLELKKGGNKVLFGFVYGTQESKDNNLFNYFWTKVNTIYNELEPFKHEINCSGEDLSLVTGDSSYQNGKYCTIFPYMSPDNNSHLGSALALLHNVNFNSGDTNAHEKYLYNSIKTFQDNPYDFAARFNQISDKEDYKPVVINRLQRYETNTLNKEEMKTKYQNYLKNNKLNGIFN